MTVTVERSITLTEPGASVLPPVVNSPSLATKTLEPSREKSTLSGWKPTVRVFSGAAVPVR